MKTTLLLFAVIVGMTFTACKKETIEVPVPTQEDAYWYLHIEGDAFAPFRIVYSGSLPPYNNNLEYSNVLCCGISPILMKLQIGKAYTVSYMDRDSVMQVIFHAPTVVENYHDTIPATVW
jgi:hypothetical protein